MHPKAPAAESAPRALPLVEVLRMAATDRMLWGSLTGLWVYDSMWRRTGNAEMVGGALAVVAGYTAAGLVFA